jgi:hypothetical protein
MPVSTEHFGKVHLQVDDNNNKIEKCNLRYPLQNNIRTKYK